MQYMFSSCRKIEKIYASEYFVTTAVTNSTNMFNNCTSLVVGNGTTYSEDYIDKEYAWIDGRVDPDTGNPRSGYFTQRP